MSATDNESRRLDAGWDDEQPAEEELDQAWDNVTSAASASALPPSSPPATEDLDSGWDDVPGDSPQTSGVRRRPHRPRRAKTQAVSTSTNPQLSPHPAEPSKKQQREHARKQRAYEAQLKQQRKVERKTERAAQARAEAAERVRLAEAEAEARKRRYEARERARSERLPSAPKAPSTTKAAKLAKPPTAEGKRQPAAARSVPPQRSLRLGVVITLITLVIVAALLLLRTA